MIKFHLMNLHEIKNILMTKDQLLIKLVLIHYNLLLKNKIESLVQTKTH